MLKLSVQEQLQRLEEQTDARVKSRARKREQHALEDNPMYKGKGKGKGKDGGGGKGRDGDGGKGKGGGGKGFGGDGGGDGGGKGKGKDGKGKDGKGKDKGKGKFKPVRPTDPEAPIGERRISDADTQRADSAQRSHGVATRALQDALLTRAAGPLASALSDARAAALTGPLVTQACARA